MQEITYSNLDTLDTFKAWAGREVPDLPSILDLRRIGEYEIPTGGKLRFNYAARKVDESVLNVLADLAEEAGLSRKYRALLSGEIMNTGERRMVLHHLTRGQLEGDVIENGRSMRAFYRGQLERIYEFTDRVRSGEIRGSTGKTFTDVVQIGIGGSDLGPRALYLALKNSVSRSPEALVLEGHFISNVDPDDAASIVSGIDAERTLFILVSKSGTTQETLTNRDFVIDLLKSRRLKELVPEKHMISVTSETSPLAAKAGYLDSFFIDDYIGGRYSSTSAVGGVILSLAFGRHVFEELLEGAHEADRTALNEDPFKNASMMDALIGVYERNVLGYPCTAVLPYSQALQRFPAHLQQLDMESNGKSVNRFGEAIPYPTGPVVFGEPGTNGQHSFYQLLHQGTDIVPLQFIGFASSQKDRDIEVDGTSSQTKLNANLAAQIIAFAKGKDDPNPNMRFMGNRPSSLIYGPLLNAESLGALLAHFENKVMFQGFLWNVNSFDQEGVQLGKILTSKVLSGKNEDRELDAYFSLLSGQK